MPISDRPVIDQCKVHSPETSAGIFNLLGGSTGRSSDFGTPIEPAIWGKEESDAHDDGVEATGSAESHDAHSPIGVADRRY